QRSGSAANGAASHAKSSERGLHTVHKTFMSPATRIGASNMAFGRKQVRFTCRACRLLKSGATERPTGGVCMTIVVLSRRNILAAGGAVLAAGASGLIVPAGAQGVTPTRTMPGGANNYRKGAPVVNKIGKGGFWMTG